MQAVDAASAGDWESALSGIGVGCPGNIDLEKGTLIDSANLGWKNFPIRESLEKAFGCPAVVLNDVDAGETLAAAILTAVLPLAESSNSTMSPSM